MKEKEIELLKAQVEKLNASNFDLEAWKTGAIILIDRIFGSGNPKISLLEKIRYDQSSWALREAKGSKNLMETCKNQGREILEIAVQELEALGAPADIQSGREELLRQAVGAALEDELKISQYKEILAIIQSDESDENKRKKLLASLNRYGKAVPENILASILLSDAVKQVLK